MSMENFRLTFHMRTGIILGKYPLLLDSLLAAAMYSEVGDVAQAIEKIPLDRTEGVWHGSAAEFIALRPSSGGGTARPITKQQVTFVSGVNPVRDHESMDGVFLYYNPSRGPYNKTGAMDYKASMEQYQMWSVPRIVFYGRGDKDACRDLAEAFLPFLGKKSSQGFGEVSSVTVDAMNDDHSIVRDGDIMRPVPVSLSDRFGNPDGLLRHMRWRPPYFSGETVQCVCPVEVHNVKIM